MSPAFTASWAAEEPLLTRLGLSAEHITTAKVFGLPPGTIIKWIIQFGLPIVEQILGGLKGVTPGA